MRVLPLVLVLAASSASADGFYATESVGGTRVKDELAARFDGGLRVRLSVGWRHKRWALEGWVARDIATTDERTGAPAGTAIDQPPSLFTYGFDLKYIRPVAHHLEVYLRGTIGHGFMCGILEDYSGRGAGMGAGVQLKGRVRALGLLAWPLFFTGVGPKVTAALFIDDGVDFYRLHAGGDLHATAIDAQLSHLTFGWAVGSDF